MVDLVFLFILSDIPENEISKHLNRRTGEPNRFRIALGDTLRHHLAITILVTGIFAILALHPCTLQQELSTKSTKHDGVELLLNKLVAILFVNRFFSLTNGPLSP